MSKLVVVPDNSSGMKVLPGVLQVKLDRSGFNALTIGGSMTLKGSGSSGPLNVPIPVSASYADD